MIKKLLFFTTIFIFQSNYAMEVESLPHIIFRKNFDNLSKAPYNKSVDYDLGLLLRSDNGAKVVHKECVTLCFHGFSASPTTMIEYARVGTSHRIPGDAVTFRFKDAFTNSGSFIFHSSFGQINDIKSSLVALRAMYDCKTKGCNLFGQSRGGGTIPNALAVLNTPIDQWDKEFNVIKESFFQKDDDRLAIIAMIKKGVVVLDTPMITSQAGINAHVNKFCCGFASVEKCVSFLMDRIILPLITRGNYNPHGPQALTSVEKMPKDLRVLVSYQKNDGSVGNLHDKEFSQALMSHLGQKNVWIVLGNDGGRKFDDATWQELNIANNKGNIQKRFWFIGLPYRAVPAHNAGFFLLFLLGVINKFFENNSCSYLSNQTKLIEGMQVLEKSQPEILDNYFTDENYDMHKPQCTIIDEPKNDDNVRSKRHYIIGFMAIIFNFLMYFK